MAERAEQTLEWLRQRRAESGDLLLGAAIGLGMTARAAAQGGADFLLALNAGRLRVMGAPSIAAMLPLRNANAFTEEFAGQEILGRVSIPLFFGAAASDPRLDLAALARRLKEAGYAGIANFPTTIHLDGRFRVAVEASGLGFSRELDLLRAAKAEGLVTLGYAKTREEVGQVLDMGVDMLCLNFGWNAGGAMGVAGAMSVDEAADRARRIFQGVRHQAPNTLCFVEGGPIVSPDDMWRVCGESRADGYIGGSTLDRLPLEMSVMRTTSAFKATAVLRAARESANREHIRLGTLAGLRGQSLAAQSLNERIASVASTDLPVLIRGEAGVGKTTVARAVHVASRRGGSFKVIDGRTPPGDLERALFGLADGAGGLLNLPDTTVTLEFIDSVPTAVQSRIVEWIDRGVLERFDVTPERPRRARLVATLVIGGEGALRDDLRARLEPGALIVPPLRERPEDVPLIARALLAGLSREQQAAAPEIDPSGHRALMAHPWPGNVRELRTVLATAATGSRDGRLDADALAPLLAAASPASGPLEPADERTWILDALRRNRFRRAETATFLRISRKTLYNKMRRHNLLD
ncbi:MAG TPA: phosphoenolpyruvate hydrolase family protein [Microvirga sp.]|nr:phosphoenolpyruvate hydrolase family protein [Microvirga sp.]